MGQSQLIRLDEVGTCVDCAVTETPYACATCRRYFCTKCAMSPSGCPYCNERWNDLQIRGKLGTHPTAIYFVQDTDTSPSVGDRIMIRSDQDVRVLSWTEVIVTEVKFGDYIYMELS